MKILRKLSSYLPVSRRKYVEALENITVIIDGLIEADANHSQIETSLIRMVANGKTKKSGKERNKNDPAFG